LKLHEAIASGNPKNLNIDNIQPKLDAIAEMDKVQAIALDINSPGGSPTQSRLIADAIRATADEMGVPVHAFVQDVAASGGYWLACIADDIYVQPESIIGSIGVVSGGFGFSELMNKVGVERRVYTAGKSKVTNDPFQPENPEGVKKGDELREKIHENFINWVKSNRGGKLDSKATLFEADVFLGQDGLGNGLADAIGALKPTVSKLYGKDTKLVKPVSAPAGIQDLFQMAGGSANSIAEAVGRGIANAAADRAENEVTWQNFRFK
jgi:serine protease SohB